MAKNPRKSKFDFSGKWKETCVEGWRKQPTIYLFRHAQTVFNKNHVFTGWLDSKLTPFGKVQAKVVARKLANKEIDVAICTTLSRSRDTLAAVLKKHPECRAIFTDDRMIERSYGKLQGHSHDKYKRTHSEEELQRIRRSYDYPPPGGESIKMVEKTRREGCLSLLRRGQPTWEKRAWSCMAKTWRVLAKP